MAYTQRLFQWLQTILPDYKASEFQPQDWTDGTLLASLLTYSSSGNQCTASKLADIIEEAQNTLGIPAILQPSDLLALDGTYVLLIYLYFFAKPGSPGQLQLMKWVNGLPPLQERPIQDFQRGWDGGTSAYEAVQCLLPYTMPSLAAVSSHSALQLTQAAVSAAEQTFHILPVADHTAVCYPSPDPFPLILFLSQLQSVKNISRYSLPSSVVLVRKDVKCLYAVGSNVSIELENADISKSALEAVVQSEIPEERLVLESAKGPDNGLTSFSFIPNHAGEFRITITCEDSEIPDSPITFDVYDSQQCELITPVQAVYSLGQSVMLQVSSALAGKGKLTATLDPPMIPQPLSSTPSASSPTLSTAFPQSTPPADVATSPQGGSLSLQPHSNAEPSSVASITLQGSVRGPSIHELSFTPGSIGEHSLSIYWNGVLIPNCPVSITVSGQSCTVQGSGVEEAFEGLESDFDIIVPYESGADCSNLAVHITYRNVAVKERIRMLKGADKHHRKYRYNTPYQASLLDILY